MIDIHCHILPGVDDGPAESEESVRMLRMAAEQGCEVMIATPHQRREWECPPRQGLEALLGDLQRAVGPRPRLELGAEVHVGADLLVDLESPDRRGLLTLAGSDHLLLEFPSSFQPREIKAVVHEVHVLGLRSVVAHPEFVAGLQTLEANEELVQMGARLQVTASSLLGGAGRVRQKFVRQLIDLELVDFVASDCHSSTWRPPDLGSAASAIERRWGEATARRLTRSNARELLGTSPRGAALDGALGSSGW